MSADTYNYFTNERYVKFLESQVRVLFIELQKLKNEKEKEIKVSNLNFENTLDYLRDGNKTLEKQATISLVKEESGSDLVFLKWGDVNFSLYINSSGIIEMRDIQHLCNLFFDGVMRERIKEVCR